MVSYLFAYFLSLSLSIYLSFFLFFLFLFLFLMHIIIISSSKKLFSFFPSLSTVRAESAWLPPSARIGSGATSATRVCLHYIYEDMYELTVHALLLRFLPQRHSGRVGCMTQKEVIVTKPSHPVFFQKMFQLCGTRDSGWSLYWCIGRCLGLVWTHGTFIFGKIMMINAITYVIFL